MDDLTARAPTHHQLNQQALVAKIEAKEKRLKKKQQEKKDLSSTSVVCSSVCYNLTSHVPQYILLCVKDFESKLETACLEIVELNKETQKATIARIKATEDAQAISEARQVSYDHVVLSLDCWIEISHQ